MVGIGLGWAGGANAAASPVPAHLSGELPADAVLNGAYPFPPSPKVSVRADGRGFAPRRVGKTPEAGVHPRILISPDDLPDLRRRVEDTSTGQALFATLRRKTSAALRDPTRWSSQLYEQLASGQDDAAYELILQHKGLPSNVGHYKPWIYAIVLEALDALISEDEMRGRKAATAIATYVRLVEPGIEKSLAEPMNDDVWRVKVSGPTTGFVSSEQGLREGLGGHLIGYAYDFAYGFMTDVQRRDVRRVISRVTKGRVWMGARLPHHFRNWNWIAVALQQPLLALAIEGEEGYDPRVYKLATEIAHDYLTYGISATGQSTEAVGYTQFGFVWGAPFFVAAQRRGQDLLRHSHHRAMLDWYLHSLAPSQKTWMSHGDGGDTGPSLTSLSMWRYFFPTDPRATVLWSVNTQAAAGVWESGGAPVESSPFSGDLHLIEPLLWADELPANAITDVAALNLPLTQFDPQRGSLISRSEWSRDAAWLQFECRVDSHGASHEHADRGAFTFSALGRDWGRDYFRSVETRHHNSILIDGLGQGYWPGPGEWQSLEESEEGLIAACDASQAYNWRWPKQILAEDPATFERFQYKRWTDYKLEAQQLREANHDLRFERDTRKAVVDFWQGFEKTDPRLWDEDGWPVRLAHNTVERAFRTIVFSRGRSPWLLVCDDIQKDGQERLYEWLMQTGFDTEVASMSGNDIILCDATVARDTQGKPQPVTGDRMLLVRVLNMNDPADPTLYQSRPSFRLEAYERKDTLVRRVTNGALAGDRSFGMDKRLVIASRSISPDYRILLFPHRSGDPLPQTRFTADGQTLIIDVAGEIRELALDPHADGRTRVRFLKGNRA